MPAGGLGPSQPNDALTAARFSITIDGYEIAQFSELSGITTEVEAVKFMESSDKEVITKQLPGQYKPATVVLKRQEQLDGVVGLARGGAAGRHRRGPQER